MVTLDEGRNAKARRIAFLSADVDGPPPVILGRAWEGSLPYATGSKIVVLAPNGSRRFTLTAADRVVALSAHSRGYAAVLASGHVLTISPTGKVLRDAEVRTWAVQDAVLAAPGLIMKTRTALEIRNGRLDPADPVAPGLAVPRLLGKGSRHMGSAGSFGSSGPRTAETRCSGRSRRASRPSSAGAESSTARTERSASPRGLS